MKVINNIIKALSYAVVHIATAIGLYITAMAFTSPIFNIVLSVLDSINKMEYVLGKITVLWLVASLLLWIVLFVYTEVKAHKK